jgi:hypothetical protein
MKKSMRIAHAEAARIMLINIRDMHDLAFDKLKAAYPEEFQDLMTSRDIHPANLVHFAVEMLSKEGAI